MPFAMATADEPRKLAAGRHDVRLELGAANTPATPALTKGYGSNHFSINSCVEKSVLYRGRISRWADWALTKRFLDRSDQIGGLTVQPVCNLEQNQQGGLAKTALKSA